MTAELGLDTLLHRHHGEYAALHGQDGSSLFVLPSGGRLLGMRPAAPSVSSAPSRPSALSARPDAQAPAHPSPFWAPREAAPPGHWNVGGDRTWIGPELEYFVDAAGQYGIPTLLDPGSWSLESHTSAEIRLGMDCVLRHNSTALPVRLQFKKCLSLLPNPLLQNGSTVSLADPAVAYAGCDTATELSLEPTAAATAQAETGYCSLWSIMQLPSGGTALIPTRGPAQPLVMFADSLPEAPGIAPQGHGAIVPCNGQAKFKLSFDAIASTGRFGYIRRLNDTDSTLVVRQFTVNPAGIYPDYPPGQPSYRGSSVQLFHDGQQFGGFAELEYHAPALPIWKPGQTSDRSQLFYFAGPAAAIDRIAEVMLGMRQ